MSALLGDECSASRCDRFTPGERFPHIHWTGCCVGTRAEKKVLALPGLELRPLGRPTRSQQLYRLRYDIL
jgi:hypothetical protein